MISEKPKLIYVTAFNSSFIKKDKELLEKYFNVIPYFFNPLPKWKTPFSLINQLLHLILETHSVKCIVCQFAGFHTVLPVLIGKLFNKKVYLILLGAECHNFPKIQHGNFRKKLLKIVTSFSLRNAYKLLPIDFSLAKWENNYDENEPKLQGFLNLASPCNTPFEVIPHGFDDIKFNYNLQNKIKNTFLTISTSVAPPVYFRKGIDLIIKVAPFFPDCTFSILCKNDYLNIKELPRNVTLLDTVPYEKLGEKIAEFEYYLQVSIAEGLPNALCEAMLCGCIPIGSDSFAIPNVIGDTGYIVKKREVEELKSTIISAITHDANKQLAENARKRIQELFPLNYREKRLIEVLME
jgi:glycosyltransferase involved in cell wall biosynthesis